MAKGRFVTFEGPDGAGKSTQLRLLVDWLRPQGIEPVITREPGGTAMGDRIREALFGAHDHGALPLTEAFLMNASRAQLVHELVLPALEQGRLVLCDRYADATLAYQGYGHGMDMTLLQQLIAAATGGLQPDLTVYLDVPVQVSLGRKHAAHGQGGELNHLDLMDTPFHQRVNEGYRLIMAADPGRWRVVDGSRPPEAVQADIRRLFESDVLTRD